MSLRRLVTSSLVVLAAAIGVATLTAAPDTKPPKIVSATMQDADGNSRADRVRLTYSERIRHLSDEDGKYPFSITGYEIRSVGPASGKTIVLALVEKTAADDAAQPAVRYRSTTSGSVRDLTGNRAAGQIFKGTRAHGNGPAGTPPPPPPPPPPSTDRDGDGTRDAQDCAPDDPKINPGAADAPDLAFVDSNCDGIDGTEKNAIFASPLGKDTNPGTRSAPKRQIQSAVAAAAAAGKDVYAAAGTYGRVEVATGVSIYGGYQPENWARGLLFVTSIAGAPEGVFAAGATDVVLQQLTVRGEPGSEAGASAYGIRLLNGANVKLQRIVATAIGGLAGAAGSNGLGGARGGDGGAGRTGACDFDERFNFGGRGGSSPAGRLGGAGGKGGSAGGKGQEGSDGAIGTPGGNGGNGGGNPGSRGNDGAAGASGAAGGNGPGGTNSAVGATTAWAGQSGEAGTGGAPGNGGGGGGGGGGQGGPFVLDGAGNGAGGGGGGGDGGRAGTGGKAGGGSFGVYLFNSTVIVSDSSSIQSGAGGPGGRGGAGGPGGPGGGRGLGATYCSGEIGIGGSGGVGGTGGGGGGGGGGAGGPSAGIFKAGASTALVTDSTISSGTPGVGGNGGTGGAGSAGAGATGIAQEISP